MNYQPISVDHRGRPLRGALNPALLLALGLGTLGAATSSAQAQDETVPLVQNVRTLQIVLATIGQEVTVKYAVDGNRIFYFPVFLLQEVTLPNGLAAVDPDGNLRLPPGDGLLNLTVTLLDLWKSRAYQDDLIATLGNHPVIRSLAATPQLLPAATAGHRRASLLLIDPNLSNQRVVLAESFLSDLADAQSRVSAQFLLDPRARTRLAGIAGGIPIRAQHLAVQVEESYRARYTTTLALISLQSAVQSLAVMRPSLLPVPDRGQPTLLLSPNLPQPGAQAGSVAQDKQFTDQIRRFVRLQVLTREGASADPQLVDRLVTAALEQAPLVLELGEQERQQAVATFLLEDGLTMTMALSEINELDAALHSASESEYRSALISSATKSQNTEVRGSAGASFGFGLFGGSASAETKQNWSRTDYVNRRMEDIKRQVRDASVRLSGQVRTLTGIRFSQSGTVENVSFTTIEQSIGTFTLGDATILGTAQEVEALRVPQVLMGLEGSEHPQWSNIGGTEKFLQIPVTFTNRFARAPQVICAISALDDWNGANTRIATWPIDVRPEGFTLHVQTWADRLVYGFRVSWVAAGPAPVLPQDQGGNLAAFGTPGQPPLIPAQARQAVLTPRLDSSPQLLDGQFQGSFNPIPGRTYLVESSTTLHPDDWTPGTSVTASDFRAGFGAPVDPSDSHRFFRVTTPHAGQRRLWRQAVRTRPLPFGHECAFPNRVAGHAGSRRVGFLGGRSRLPTQPCRPIAARTLGCAERLLRRPMCGRGGSSRCGIGGPAHFRWLPAAAGLPRVREVRSACFAFRWRTRGTGCGQSGTNHKPQYKHRDADKT